MAHRADLFAQSPFRNSQVTRRREGSFQAGRKGAVLVGPYGLRLNKSQRAWQKNYYAGNRKQILGEVRVKRHDQSFRAGFVSRANQLWDPGKHPRDAYGRFS